MTNCNHRRRPRVDKVKYSVPDPVALAVAIGSGFAANGEALTIGARNTGAGILAAILTENFGLPTSPVEMFDACVELSGEPDTIRRLRDLFGIAP